MTAPTHILTGLASVVVAGRIGGLTPDAVLLRIAEPLDGVEHALLCGLGTAERLYRVAVAPGGGDGSAKTRKGGKSSEVSVTDEADESLRLRFTVTDTGPGIDEATREGLFAAFASGVRPASSQRYGSGLGLTISKQLLDNMGGSIDIGARDQGGTKVAFDVPVTRANSSSSGDLAAHPDGRLQRVFSMFTSNAQQKSICRLLDHWDIR